MILHGEGEATKDADEGLRINLKDKKWKIENGNRETRMNEGGGIGVKSGAVPALPKRKRTGGSGPFEIGVN
jgi:hypothetical protein